jgi:gluconolactonase
MGKVICAVIRCGLAFAPQLVLAQATGGVQGDPSIVAPTARLERLFGEAIFTEGPAQAPDGSVYFSDITLVKRSGYQAGHIWRWDPRTGTTTVFRSPSGMSNGIEFDAEGRMVVAEGAGFGGRRITRTDMKTGKSVILAGLFNGRPFNSPNDLILDARGRIYFTDPRYSGHEPVEQPVQGVYRIDLDGRVSLVAADVGKPNGIPVSPDQATLYIASLDNGSLDDLPPDTPTTNGRMALLAYDLAPDGSARFRRTVVDFAPGIGPDGVSVDRDGNIYGAIPAPRPGIHVFSPAGKELAYISTPETPTNVKFGRGADHQTLFITAGKSLYRIHVERVGYHPGS